ncbi:hypothetical protein RI367_003364 [Sorochytrium milnesiophthora]
MRRLPLELFEYILALAGPDVVARLRNIDLLLNALSFIRRSSSNPRQHEELLAAACIKRLWSGGVLALIGAKSHMPECSLSDLEHIVLPVNTVQMLWQIHDARLWPLLNWGGDVTLMYTAMLALPDHAQALEWCCRVDPVSIARFAMEVMRRGEGLEQVERICAAGITQHSLLHVALYAVRHGRMDVFGWTSQQARLTSAYLVLAAIESGRVAVLQEVLGTHLGNVGRLHDWIERECGRGSLREVLAQAARDDHRELLQWCVAQRMLPTMPGEHTALIMRVVNGEPLPASMQQVSRSYIGIAANGALQHANLYTLRDIVARCNSDMQMPWHERSLRFRAVKHGDLGTVRWLYSAFPARQSLTYATQVALEHGHLELAQWLCQYGGQYPRLLQLDHEQLARQGRLDIFIWLRTHTRFQADEHILQAAQAAGQHSLAQWLAEQLAAGDPESPWRTKSIKGKLTYRSSHKHLAHQTSFLRPDVAI